MMRPRFEDPINSVQDLVARNITLIDGPLTFAKFKSNLLAQNTSDFTTIANNMIVVANLSDVADMGRYNELYYETIRTKILEEGTHAIVQSYLTRNDLIYGGKMEKWWKSTEPFWVNGNGSSIGFSGYQTRKKWIFNEVLKFKVKTFIDDEISGIWTFASNISAG